MLKFYPIINNGIIFIRLPFSRHSLDFSISGKLIVYGCRDTIIWPISFAWNVSTTNQSHAFFPDLICTFSVHNNQIIRCYPSVNELSLLVTTPLKLYSLLGSSTVRPMLFYRFLPCYFIGRCPLYSEKQKG